MEQQKPLDQSTASPAPSAEGKAKGWTIAGITISTVVLFIIAIPFLCVLVSICTIVILALLGPAIGNIFSNITANI